MFLKLLFILIFLLVSVAYFTLAERKILGALQRRRGPNVIGVYGLLQPLSDGLKLLMKEAILPSNASRFIFIVSPMFTFLISLLGWIVIPFGKFSIASEINLGILYLFTISSLGIYGIVMSGWSSNSKYAFLGALRSTAQMVSYEVSLGLIISIIVTCSGSFNLQTIINSQVDIWYFFIFSPLFLIFFISSLAETNRHPFDLPEAEAELVSGYNVEYSAMAFALFSLGEYSNMLMMSAINSILFFGGYLPIVNISFLSNHFLDSFWFSIKICFFVILFIWMRGALPRYRYDQLMFLGWKIFLPISLTYLVFTFFVLYTFNLLPY